MATNISPPSARSAHPPPQVGVTESAKEALAVELAESIKLHGDGMKEVVSLKKVVQQLKDEMHENDAASGLLKSKVKDAEAAGSAKDKKMGEMEVRIHELQGEVAKLREFEESSEYMHSKVKKVEAELERCTLEVSESRKKELASDGDLKELTLKFQRMTDGNEAITLDLDAKKAEVSHERRRGARPTSKRFVGWSMLPTSTLKTNNSLAPQVRILRETLDSVRAANVAKDDAVEASARKAEIALSGKAIVEKEIEELRGSVVMLAKSKRAAEGESSEVRRELDALKIESEDLRNRLRRTENNLVEARNDAAVGEEVRPHPPTPFIAPLLTLTNFVAGGRAEEPDG